jgi:uncharacterized membrane protein YhiD involved in acid resistance
VVSAALARGVTPSALGVAALIGLERSFHDRAAAFRTTLVCIASALLMLVTVYQNE